MSCNVRSPAAERRRGGMPAVLAAAVLLSTGAAAAGGYDRVGEASWYGPGYQGRTTASGEAFDMNGLTAAHRRLAFGTRVRVTNLANRRSLIVRINDRGPFARGRIIDLSRRAAHLLGFRHRGVTRVRVQAIGTDQLAARIRESLRVSRYPPPIWLRLPDGARH